MILTKTFLMMTRAWNGQGIVSILKLSTVRYVVKEPSIIRLPIDKTMPVINAIIMSTQW
jgi:hypothetical protein